MKSDISRLDPTTLFDYEWSEILEIARRLY